MLEQFRVDPVGYVGEQLLINHPLPDLLGWEQGELELTERWVCFGDLYCVDLTDEIFFDQDIIEVFVDDAFGCFIHRPCDHMVVVHVTRVPKPDGVVDTLEVLHIHSFQMELAFGVSACEFELMGLKGCCRH